MQYLKALNIYLETQKLFIVTTSNIGYAARIINVAN